MMLMCQSVSQFAPFSSPMTLLFQYFGAQISDSNHVTEILHAARDDLIDYSTVSCSTQV